MRKCMKSFLKDYSLQNTEKFNLDFIYLKDKENIMQYIDDICEALNIVKGIEYMGSEFIGNERESVLKEDKNVNSSRMNLIKMRFRVTGHSNKHKKELSEEIEVPVLFPKIIDRFYFIHNGNYYFPIWQIVDKDTYVVGHGERRQLVLKTLLLPIVLRYRLAEFKDMDEENVVKGRIFDLNLFSKKINFLYYYVTNFGINETISYFGYSEYITVLESPCQLTDSNSVTFQVGNKLYLAVDQDKFKEGSLDFNNFVCSMIDFLLESKPKFKNLEEGDYWKKKLGSIFTKNLNNQIDKVRSIILSFERILDARTKKVLKVSERDKEDTYAVVRWMIQNYYDLSIKDNMHLENKRLRLYEYMVNPLLRKFSKATYRMLNNKNEKKNTFEQLKSVFSNVKLNIVIKKLVQLDLLRYNNSVNGMDLFNSALKGSFKGPQSMITPGKSSNVGLRYRSLHPSYMGHVSLTFSSAGDPGMTIMFTPFTKVEEDLLFDSTPFKPSGKTYDESYFENYLDELAYDDEESSDDD